MWKKLSFTGIVMLILAFLSLIYAEILWFTWETDAALFVGLWVPSILCFAIYIKLLKIGSK